MRNVLRRLAYWIRHRRHEADVADDMELHRSLEPERFERERLTARVRSRQTLGNVALAREDTRIDPVVALRCE